jgi:hypothetical protein
MNRSRIRHPRKSEWWSRSTMVTAKQIIERPPDQVMMDTRYKRCHVSRIGGKQGQTDRQIDIFVSDLPSHTTSIARYFISTNEKKIVELRHVRITKPNNHNSRHPENLSLCVRFYQATAHFPFQTQQDPNIGHSTVLRVPRDTKARYMYIYTSLMLFRFSLNIDRILRAPSKYWRALLVDVGTFISLFVTQQFSRICKAGIF